MPPLKDEGHCSHTILAGSGVIDRQHFNRPDKAQLLSTQRN